MREKQTRDVDFLRTSHHPRLGFLDPKQHKQYPVIEHDEAVVCQEDRIGIREKSIFLGGHRSLDVNPICIQSALV